MKREVLAKNLRVAILLHISLFVAEILTAMFTGSLVILADGIHLYGNIFAITLAWTAYTLQKEERPDRLCICLWKRDIRLLGFNSVIMLLLTMLVIFQATRALVYPSSIDAGAVTIIAFFALLINWFVLGLFRVHKHRDLRKISYHLTGNLLSSFVVFISALFTLVLGNRLFDIVGAFLIAIVLITNTLRLGRRTLVMRLHKKLVDIDLKEVEKTILKKDVKKVEKLSAWHVYDDEQVINATITIKKKDLSHITRIIKDIKKRLRTQQISFAGLRIRF